MSLVTRLNRLTALRNVIAGAQRNARCISTSQKKGDAASISTENVESKPLKTVEDFANPTKSKDWVYWGFDTRDRKADSDEMHATFFFSVSLCLVGAAFVWYYQPDFLMRDWTQREAYLELRRREAAGVDLISPDYVPASQIELPLDEDLGNTEIII